MTLKQYLLLCAGLFLILVTAAACSGLSPSPTPTLPLSTPASPVLVAESLAQAFISAYEAKQAEDWLALFSNDALFMDNGHDEFRKEWAHYMRNEQTFVKHLFSLKNFSMKFISYFVSDDGRFIALNGTYTFTGKDGNLASVPIMIILEVEDGKIIREDDYFDGSPFFY